MPSTAKPALRGVDQRDQPGGCGSGDHAAGCPAHDAAAAHDANEMRLPSRDEIPGRATREHSFRLIVPNGRQLDDTNLGERGHERNRKSRRTGLLLERGERLGERRPVGTVGAHRVERHVAQHRLGAGADVGHPQLAGGHRDADVVRTRSSRRRGYHWRYVTFVVVPLAGRVMSAISRTGCACGPTRADIVSSIWVVATVATVESWACSCAYAAF
jgi:hypothetical protein